MWLYNAHMWISNKMLMRQTGYGVNQQVNTGKLVCGLWFWSVSLSAVRSKITDLHTTQCTKAIGLTLANVVPRTPLREPMSTNVSQMAFCALASYETTCANKLGRLGYKHWYVMNMHITKSPSKTAPTPQTVVFEQTPWISSRQATPARTNIYVVTCVLC